MLRPLSVLGLLLVLVLPLNGPSAATTAQPSHQTTAASGSSLADLLAPYPRTPLSTDGSVVSLAVPAHPTRAASPTVAMPQQNPDDLWDDRFGPPGVTCCAGFDKVFAVEVVGSSVFVGGEFRELGALRRTSGIGEWNGRRWFNLGGGLLRNDGDLPGIVYDLASDGTDLYVVGNFTQAGELSVNGIVRWNIASRSWHRVGNGDGPLDEFASAVAPEAVAVVDGEVFIGGSFISVDGVDAYRLARWDGTHWSPLAGGVANEFYDGDERVYAIVARGDSVYVGGLFRDAVNPLGVAAVQANNIAVWSRSNERWVALGGGVDTTVTALALDGGTLYAGGSFREAGGTIVNRIARWNGTSWAALGSGADGRVNELVIADDGLIAAGLFSEMGDVASTNSLARWDGNTWQSLRSDLLFSDPVDDYINAVGVLPDGALFVGGDFNDTGLPKVTNLAIWDGERWRGTGYGFEDGSTAILGGDGYAVAVHPSGQVFVGGDFTEIGGLPYAHIAMWDGEDWHAIGGTDGDVSALVLRGDELYVGGGFSQVGDGVAAIRVAKYHVLNKTWSAIGDGLPEGYVNTLAFVGDTLYAGGSGFPSQTECCLWKWNGQTWAPFSERFRTDPFFAAFARTTVLALASDGEQLLVGGVFLDLYARADSSQILVNDLFVYNPSADTIAIFGSGADNNDLPSSINALTLAADGIYVGGRFTSIDGVAALNIAQLGTGGWAALGSGVQGDDPVVSTIVSNAEFLYVGGAFEVAGGEAFNIARWSPTSRSWSTLGCGITRNGETVSIARVAEIAIQPAGLPNAGLYAAGGIYAAGCKPAMGFAAWYGVGASAPAPGELSYQRWLPLVVR
jgi:hypothetical protein